VCKQAAVGSAFGEGVYGVLGTYFNSRNSDNEIKFIGKLLINEPQAPHSSSLSQDFPITLGLPYAPAKGLGEEATIP
jgi:hypothetical protein